MFAANLLIMLYRSGPAALVDKHQVRLVAQLGREGFQSLSRVVPTSIEAPVNEGLDAPPQGSKQRRDQEGGSHDCQSGSLARE
jgi:hypothetical protein